jgi:hypothetical protein
MKTLLAVLGLTRGRDILPLIETVLVRYIVELLTLYLPKAWRIFWTCLKNSRKTKYIQVQLMKLGMVSNGYNDTRYTKGIPAIQHQPLLL